MDVNSIDAAIKYVLSVIRPSSEKSNPPKTVAPISKAPKLENDSVTLSEEGKQSLKKVNQVPNADSVKGQKEFSDVSSISIEADSQRKLSVTDDKQVILKIIDSKTKDVIKQLPPEEEVRLKEAMRNMAENFVPPEHSQ